MTRHMLVSGRGHARLLEGGRGQAGGRTFKQGGRITGRRARCGIGIGGSGVGGGGGRDGVGRWGGRDASVRGYSVTARRRHTRPALPALPRRCLPPRLPACAAPPPLALGRASGAGSRRRPRKDDPLGHDVGCGGDGPLGRDARAERPPHTRRRTPRIATETQIFPRRSTRQHTCALWCLAGPRRRCDAERFRRNARPGWLTHLAALRQAGALDGCLRFRGDPQRRSAIGRALRRGACGAARLRGMRGVWALGATSAHGVSYSLGGGGNTPAKEWHTVTGARQKQRGTGAMQEHRGTGAMAAGRGVGGYGCRPGKAAGDGGLGGQTSRRPLASVGLCTASSRAAAATALARLTLAGRAAPAQEVGRVARGHAGGASLTSSARRQRPPHLSPGARRRCPGNGLKRAPWRIDVRPASAVAGRQVHRADEVASAG
eukprot:scaffold1756_cov117-Isochrysis_galbana.AAC.12